MLRSRAGREGLHGSPWYSQGLYSIERGALFCLTSPRLEASSWHLARSLLPVPAALKDGERDLTGGPWPWVSQCPCQSPSVAFAHLSSGPCPQQGWTGRSVAMFTLHPRKHYPEGTKHPEVQDLTSGLPVIPKTVSSSPQTNAGLEGALRALGRRKPGEVGGSPSQGTIARGP